MSLISFYYMKCITLNVSGKVQGVFFRASTKDEADRLGIKGFVKNERDGSVYIEAEGEDESLKHFVEWCRVGPAHAVVADVKIAEVEPRSFSVFKISR